MKVILVGYPGSQRIVPASKYLTSKYLPSFDITYLNYEGEINDWAEFLADYLRSLPDKHVIFALDDYLVSGFNKENYKEAEYFLKNGHGIGCIKLCRGTAEEHFDYPVTTQYSIWKREYLIWFLEQVKTPWEFELGGSTIVKESIKSRDKRTLQHIALPCIDYFTNSCLSSRWEGVKLDGLKDEDIKYLKENGYV